MTSASVNRFLTAAGVLALLASVGCRGSKPPASEAIGEAYVVPESLVLRQDIPPASPSAGTAKRGERVEITARRRRFVKVRTPAGVEGWIEESQLLAPDIYRQIEQASLQAGERPSLGTYRARDILNVHIEHYRWSPSFYQLKEDEKVELLGRQIAERTSGPRVSAAAEAKTTGKTIPYEEWCLVRTTEGRAGWVLARMIDAAIPDEVAQYAEGRRITSYFPLSEVIDGNQVKKVWLWTTTARQLEPHDFDSIRVFNWGRRRHRYETAHIERGIKGYYPVTVAPKVETKFGSGPGFSLTIEKKDGQRYIRRYVMTGYLVRIYAEEPTTATPAAVPVMSQTPAVPQPVQPSFWQRLWKKVRRGDG